VVKKTLVFLCLVYVVLIGIAPAGDSMPGEMIASNDEISSPPVYMFYLKPAQTGENLYVYPQIDPRKEVEFKKEPNLGRGKIFRKILQLGKDGKIQIPFAWNKSKARLYIDFNRNLDLTDDPNNVFSASEKRYYQKFDNIPITIRIKDRPVIYNVSFYFYESREMQCYLYVSSSWQGDIDLPGLKARMTVFDDMDGEIEYSEIGMREAPNDRFTLQPLSFKDRSTTYTAGSFHSFTQLPISRKVHLNESSYNISYEFEKQGEEVLLKTIFEESNPDLGIIRLPGKYIKELILYGEYQVLLYSPAPEMKIPAGSYIRGQILLSKPDSTREISGDPNGFTLNKDKTLVYRVGGPLKSLVKISPMGRSSLNLLYSLSGIGDEEYTGPDRDNPPRFEIYKGDKKIFSDKFSFG